MNKCCPKFPEGKIRNLGGGKYRCGSCNADISKLLVEMFFMAPHETVELVKKNNGGIHREHGSRS